MLRVVIVVIPCSVVQFILEHFEVSNETKKYLFWQNKTSIHTKIKDRKMEKLLQRCSDPKIQPPPRVRFDVVKLHARKVRGLVDDELRDYLLDCVPYLNTHHLLTSERMAAERDGAKEADLLNFTRLEMKNSDEYVRRFHESLLDQELPEEQAFRQCQDCGGVVEEVENSYMVCSQCSVVQDVGLSYDQSKNLNWSELVDNNPGRQYTYRRLNHFREYLRQIQGKCKGRVPLEVIDAVKSQCRKTRQPYNQITGIKVKKFLKSVKKAPYYEYCENIACAINPSYQPVQIAPEHEEKLCLMFVQLEKPFDKVKHLVNSKRKNFFSYPYTFFKLNELNSWDNYNVNCVLLKSVALLNEQDKWWKLVMKELGWENVGPTYQLL